MIVINAVYLKSRWAKPFKPSKTKTDSFACADNTEKDVKMMRQKNKFKYAEVDLGGQRAKAMEMEYTVSH